MAIYILELLFVIFLFCVGHKNKCYVVLCILQLVSICLAPLVGNNIGFETATTFLNVFYSFITLSLIIIPWSNANFDTIVIRRLPLFLFYKKWLYRVLKVTIVNNLIVFAIVMVYIPDIANFKASSGYQDLYYQIPYFGLLFRYTSVSRYLGIMAMPIWIYYLNTENKKEANKAILMSTATLFAAFAFYSRAQIVTYTLIVVCLFFLTNSTLSARLNYSINKKIKMLVLIIAGLFLSITFIRFTAMSYYGDRIPKNSMIKDPILYSLIDYSSKGFPNGISQLEFHETKDFLYGESCFNSLFMTLSYFHLLNWSTDEYAGRLQKTYRKSQLGDENDERSFHGYTCRMVKNFGYIVSLFLNILYYLYVRKLTKNRKSISIGGLTILTYLIVQPINSIFYMDYDMLSFPVVFYLVILFVYKVSGRSSYSLKTRLS